jgi:D-beta-D-heptose 7-phosphate kinase/D-beta-D-heptose 1-phosphate adenosyltransferase
MQTLLPTSLPDFEKGSVIVIGDVMLDRYWFGDTGRVSPEAPVPIVKVNRTDNRPGGAGNVAINLSSLGTQVQLLGCTGNDDAARILETQLSVAGISHHLCKLNDADTIIKLRVISRNQQLLRLDFERPLHAVNELTENYKQRLTTANLVILSDYQKGTLSDPKTLIQMAKQAHVPVLVDPKGSDFSIYEHATILTPNFKEFTTVVGECNTEQDILDKSRALLAKYNIQYLLVTRGEDGMTLIEANNHYHFPAYAREVFDVTGAGDTVIGVLGAAIASGMHLPSAVALANLAASITVSKLGATAVSAPELEVALTGKTSFTNGVVNEEQLLKAVREVRAQKKKIVFTNGCYDILHAGHVMCLQMAKQLGDYLIVAVNTDESIRANKGPDRPINNLDHRMTVLSGLGVVDWVIPFSDPTPERLLELIKPDFLAKGGDYNLDQVVGAEIVRSYGGEVRIMNHNIKTSSTSIINSLHEPAIVGST